jgi:hypothetical protein
VWWCARLPPALERLDDDHVSTAAWTRRIDIGRLFQHVVIGWWRNGEQCRATIKMRTRDNQDEKAF